MSTSAEFNRAFGIPIDDPELAPPAVHRCSRLELRLRSRIGRVRHGGRRLAYVDTHFPWRGSGFRYAEALAIAEARPDSLFFSYWPLTHPFPAPVHPLADFPRLATTAGVTDVYCVFLLCAAGLTGEDPSPVEQDHPMCPPDLSEVFEHARMALHVGLYPGGGLFASDESAALARRVCDRLTSAYSWSPLVLGLPRVVEVPPALVDTETYRQVSRDFRERPLRLLFAAENAPRKGLEIALAAYELLGADATLEVVTQPQPDAETRARHPQVTWHEWLSPQALNERFRDAHVVLNPVRTETTPYGVHIDGFPTTSASSAMATGCLLITGNPRRDHAVLTPDVTHLETEPADAPSLAEAVRRVLDDPQAAAAIAAAGSARVRDRLDVRGAMRDRLTGIGLL